MEIKIKEIGKLQPLSNSFTAYKDCILYSVTLSSLSEGKVARFISFTSSSSLKNRSLEGRLRAMIDNRLSHEDLCLIFTEYSLEKN